VRVEGFFRSRGGPDHAYRLRIAPPPSLNFRLHLATDALTLNRGGQGKLRLLAQRPGGFALPIALQIEGLPKGVTVSGTTIAANQAAVDLIFKADKSATIQASRLTIRGTAKVGGRTLTHIATLPGLRGLPELDTVLLAVALPTPFKIIGKYDMRWAARGTFVKRHYAIERNGFIGPIQIQVADHQARHLQGTQGPTITVPAGISEFDYPLFLPPWMETGRTSRTCVMAVGVIKDQDGREHRVCFTSVQPNEQVIVVVEPGRLDVELDRTTLTAVPGKTVTVPVRVARGKSLKGPVKIELIIASHLHGISAAALTVPAVKSSGELTLRFASDLKGPFNMPLLIRATMMENGKPVVGETKLELRTETR
jgi:hypothetical protein